MAVSEGRSSSRKPGIAASTIGLPAVMDPANLNDVVAGADEQEPVIADPESQFFRVALKSLDITSARFRESMQRMQDAHGSPLIQSANVGPGLLCPGNSLHVGSR